MFQAQPPFVMTDDFVHAVADQVASGAVAAVAEEVTRRQRPPLEPRRARRREQLMEQLHNPYILAEDAGQLTFEANRIQNAFQPRNAWQDWLVSAIATLMFRISRCDRIERKLRDLASFRAIDLWAEDQALEVENLAVRLPRHPSRVVTQLRDTPAGIDWLIARWESLARVEPSAWTEAERHLACLLLGGNPTIDPTEPGFARARVSDLRDLYGRIEQADALTRTLVEADLCDDKVAGLARLRRYTRSLQRQMKWYIDQFHVEHPDRWDDPMRQPGTIGYDLLAQQQQRRTAWTFAEPQPSTPPAPAVDETNPPPTAASHSPASPVIDATKPSVTAAGRSEKSELPGFRVVNETNPLAAVPTTRMSPTPPPSAGPSRTTAATVVPIGTRSPSGSVPDGELLA